MTTEHARQIAEEIASNIFGAGASETQRLGGLAVSTIHALAAQLDAVTAPPAAVEDVPAAKRKPAHAHDTAKKGKR
jgi:hypothetical protein